MRNYKYTLNPSTPNYLYMSRTAPLTSKRSILYIYSTNVGAEYFKHALYSLFFPLQNAVCFIMLTSLVPVLFTLYIQDVLKLKKNNSGAKGLISISYLEQQLIPKKVGCFCDRPRFVPSTLGEDIKWVQTRRQKPEYINISLPHAECLTFSNVIRCSLRFVNPYRTNVENKVSS